MTDSKFFCADHKPAKAEEGYVLSKNIWAVTCGRCEKMAAFEMAPKPLKYPALNNA